MDVRRPILVITGCNGMIARYVREVFADHDIHGICYGDSSSTDDGIIRAYFDMNDTCRLESYLLDIKPDIIVHLAAISSAHFALHNPIMALQTNGMVTSHLCDIIHRNKLKTKLFNASSSEIYKGHVNHTVTDADTHFYHRHPYSIAKAMGHSIVEFYRAEYGLPFSNGVLFTTESEHRLPAFLLSKVANHIKDWIPDKLPLEVGNLDSYRNVIHATDVARAIRVIVSQDYGDSYVICNEESHTMVDIVMRMLSIAGFTVELRHGVIIYDVVSDTPIIIIRTSLAGNEPAPTDIRGISTKLKALGWVPTMSDINQVLRESYGTK